MAEKYSREAILKRLESKGIEISPKGIEKAAREGRISPDFFEAAMFAAPFDLSSYGPAGLRAAGIQPSQVTTEERPQTESIFAPPGGTLPAMTDDEREFYKNRFFDFLEEVFLRGTPRRFNLGAEADQARRERMREYEEEGERLRRRRAEEEALEAEALREDVLPEIREGGDAPGGGR